MQIMGGVSKCTIICQLNNQTSMWVNITYYFHMLKRMLLHQQTWKFTPLTFYFSLIACCNRSKNER